MDKPDVPRTIDVLLFDDVHLLDVAGPVQAFEAAESDGRRRYVHRFVSGDGRPVRASCGIQLGVDGALSAESRSSDLLIPGGKGIDAVAADESVLAIIRKWSERSDGHRLISVCSGALALASAGVLDGTVSTTHWSRAKDAERYPRVGWDLNRIFTISEHVFTSAGVTTGIDLAIEIIRKDCGAEAALSVARKLVVQLRRTGGQSQFASHLAGQFSTEEDHLTSLIEKVVADPAENWTSDMLALTAGMHPRTLLRRFKAELGKTPAQFVECARIDHARALLARNRPLKQVAIDSGFGDLQRMRRAFKRQIDVDPGTFAKTFRTSANIQ